MATDAGRFPDPWPSVQPSWPAAPWTMTGTVLTAWLELPRDALTSLISPSLVPDADDVRPSRLRFYDVDFRSADPDATRTATAISARRSIGVPAAYEGQTGEVSALMWSDSDTYMHWGRDVFGWPILRALVTLDGALAPAISHRRRPPTRASTCRTRSHASITISRRRRRAPPPPAAWFTPRLVPEPASSSERRELLVVRPVPIDSGSRHELSGSRRAHVPRTAPACRDHGRRRPNRNERRFRHRVGDRVELL